MTAAGVERQHAYPGIPARALRLLSHRHLTGRDDALPLLGNGDSGVTCLQILGPPPAPRCARVPRMPGRIGGTSRCPCWKRSRCQRSGTIERELTEAVIRSSASNWPPLVQAIGPQRPHRNVALIVRFVRQAWCREGNAAVHKRCSCRPWRPPSHLPALATGHRCLTPEAAATRRLLTASRRKAAARRVASAGVVLLSSRMDSSALRRLLMGGFLTREQCVGRG